MRRRTAENDSAPGHDSFLDIVANIVGILIILVMVVGAQAKGSWVARSHDESQAQAAQAAAEDQAEREALAAQQQHVAALQGDVERLAAQAVDAQQVGRARFVERNQLQALAVELESQIEAERARLDSAQQTGFDLRREVYEAEKQLEDLTNAKLATENAAAPVTVLKHLPTPMAKTVFGNEEHFRLLGGRLTHVPLNELVQGMKQQAEIKLYKLKDADRITEVVGPVEGFSIKYTLERRKAAMNTSQGSVVREVADLESFEMVPSDAVLGEPLDVALAQGSEFQKRLLRLDPNNTTITVWTYPDSFADFRRLKDVLFASGFLTAGRPLPDGHPIGGSPHGSHSAVQ
ncbi:MAG: hypothetical protein KDA41_05540 [Planctomycetales bacterium]|nr:hypothetical protein [Planctomycetales bacterium]